MELGWIDFDWVEHFWISLGWTELSGIGLGWVGLGSFRSKFKLRIKISEQRNKMKLWARTWLQHVMPRLGNVSKFEELQVFITNSPTEKLNWVESSWTGFKWLGWTEQIQIRLGWGELGGIGLVGSFPIKSQTPGQNARNKMKLWTRTRLQRVTPQLDNVVTTTVRSNLRDDRT